MNTKSIKEFFRPTKVKILISLLLAGISSIIIIFAPALPGILFPFYFGMILFYTHPVYFTIIIFIIVSYPFGCYISKNKKWLKGIILYLIAFIIVPICFFFVINIYNDIFGYSCSTDSDCHFVCGVGAINNKYILLEDPFLSQAEIFPSDSCLVTTAICENNQCISFRKDLLDIFPKIIEQDVFSAGEISTYIESCYDTMTNLPRSRQKDIVCYILNANNSFNFFIMEDEILNNLNPEVKEYLEIETKFKKESIIIKFKYPENKIIISD